MATKQYLHIEQSQPLHGTVLVNGAKNAALVTIASLLLTKGKSILHNIPNNSDVQNMIKLLAQLGAQITFDTQSNVLTVNTTNIINAEVNPDIMNKMRASILVMGPLLGLFNQARVALPGGCLIGARPINYHLYGFEKMGVAIHEEKPYVIAVNKQNKEPLRIAFEYPSVGATENIMMFACTQPRETLLINISLEPEVLNLIAALQKMGADISIKDGTCILIRGGKTLHPIEHSIIPDRLEAGTLLLAACITKGSIHIANAYANHMDLFLEKLKEMGHSVIVGTNPSKENPLQGIKIFATEKPQAITVKTGPYPGFPTDLQAPLMATLCLAKGQSSIEETVFENRMVHVKELLKFGAEIEVTNQKAIIRSVDTLYGSEAIATDIRASSALVIAALAAEGETHISGIHHWLRGYDQLDKKLNKLGANISTATKTKKKDCDHESKLVADNSDTSIVMSD